MKIGSKIIDGFDDIVFAEDLPEGYDDITSVQNFIEKGSKEFKDYKWVRKRLQEFDWNTLTENEKMLVAQRKATSIANCKVVLGENYEYFMTDFDIKSIECRTKRYSWAKTILIKNVSVTDQYNILGAMGVLAINYMSYGIEGTTEGDPIDGLFNFIEATSGYASNGILAMNLTMTNSVTKEEMVEKIMDCLRDGEY